jgi:hypothetical protein
MAFEIEQPIDAGPSPVVEPTKPRLLGVLGPGLITGASDDDPSGIATYSQAGAQFGYALTWTMLFTYPLMTAAQIVSARMGRTTGRGIAGNLRQHCPPWLQRAKQKIRVPDHRQRRCVDAQCPHHLRGPVVLHRPPQPLELRSIGTVHDPRPVLSIRRVRTSRRGWNQRLDQLMPETGDLGAAHVATDHAFRQARLKGLIDDAAAPSEIRFAARHESGERHVFGHASALRVEDAYPVHVR